MKSESKPLVARRNGIRILETGPGWVSFLVEAADGERAEHLVARIGLEDFAWLVHKGFAWLANGCDSFAGPTASAELTLRGEYRLTFSDTDVDCPVTVPMDEPFRSLFFTAVRQLAPDVLRLPGGEPS